jgi:protein-S-isoprenylcysteine O-methyltransferase Ste14
MEIKPHVAGIDLGRLLAVTVFGLLMTFNTLIVYNEANSLFPLTSMKATLFIHRLLLSLFYVIVIGLYFLRSSAVATSRALPAKSVALLASFLPFAIPFLGSPPDFDLTMVSVSNLIMVFGMTISVVALSTLGRSFSIIPQARKLVRSGPYRFVRHPLYLGELISVLGFVLAHFVLEKLLAFLLLAACQIYRALQEEKLLSHSFPDYDNYASKTARFIPGFY